jgi:polyisoprenoid-binding protein YceI
MRIAFLVLGLLALLAVNADAAAWKVDHAKSKLWFEGQWSDETFSATFGTWDANIQFDPANLPASKAAVTIDLGSVAADEDDLTSGMKGPLGFAVRQFPQATFVTSSIRSAGGNNYIATGALTIHGIAKQIQLPFTLAITDASAHMTGAVTVARTDYGVGTGSSMGMDWASEKPVARAIRIRVDLTATKQ